MVKQVKRDKHCHAIWMSVCMHTCQWVYQLYLLSKVYRNENKTSTHTMLVYLLTLLRDHQHNFHHMTTIKNICVPQLRDNIFCLPPIKCTRGCSLHWGHWHFGTSKHLCHQWIFLAYFSKVYLSKVYLSKVYFCKVYPVNTSFASLLNPKTALLFQSVWVWVKSVSWDRSFATLL